MDNGGATASSSLTGPETSLITKVRDYFTKKRKGTSRSFNRASRVLEIVAEATGISPIKAFSLAFKEAAAYLTKKERKELKKKVKHRFKEYFKNNKKTSDFQESTLIKFYDLYQKVLNIIHSYMGSFLNRKEVAEEEENEILNKLGLTREDISTKSEFLDLKKELDDLQEKVDRLLDMVSDMKFISGCRRIQEKFRAMALRAEKNLSEWVNEFYKNKDNFSEALFDFSKKNVCDYLNYVYEMKCSENMQPMFEAFRFLLHSRTLYMLILTTYYANITELVFHENPNVVPEKQILTEIELCESDIEEIEKAADSVVGGCFMAIINSKANLGYVPRFQDISDRNYVGNFSQKDLAIAPMDINTEYEIFASEGFEALYSQKSSFIKCKSTTNNYERIVSVKEGVVHLGGFRTRFKDGSECLGNVTATKTIILYMDNKKRIHIFDNGNVMQWNNNLQWEENKEEKKFYTSEWFKETPEYYIINPKGFTPLVRAIQSGKLDDVKYLLRYGANVNDKDKYGTTPLMYATGNGHEEIVKTLTEHGANINYKNNIGDNALMWATKRGHAEIVKYLLVHGASVNDKNDNGFTGLMLAARGGYSEIVQYLIEYGANLNDKNCDGYSAVNLAYREGYNEVAQLIRANSVKQNML